MYWTEKRFLLGPAWIEAENIVVPDEAFLALSHPVDGQPFHCLRHTL